MPVRFDRSPPPPVRQVLQYLVDQPLFVVIGSDRSFDRCTLIHWLPEPRRGVPCTHEDCPWCPAPVRSITYVPVLAYTNAGRHWKEKVLPINDGMSAFLVEEREHVIWEFIRRRYKNAPVTWSRYDREKYSQPFAGFNVVDSLFRMWGMFGNARRTAAHPGEETPRLFDEPPAASAAG